MPKTATGNVLFRRLEGARVYVRPPLNGILSTCLQAPTITVDPEILGGTPVFAGTRVPVNALFDYLEDDYSLDECVPQQVRRLLPDHSCRSAQQMGWKAIKNGELLKLAEDNFHLFITCDQGLQYQQNLQVIESRFFSFRQTSSAR